jgi:uncharacterized RDD family membrane protein YckC
MEQVDNRLAVETPEGVAFELDLAGVLPRAAAYVVDLMLRMGVLTAFGMAMIPFGGFGDGVILIVAFVIVWAYYPLFEVLWEGQTPGKRVFGLRTVNRDGTHVGWYGAVVRNLIRVVDMMPVGYVAGLVAMVTSGRFQRLGDIAGDTVVVYRRSALTMAEQRRLPPVEPVQLSLVLSGEEQQAVVAFAERYATLGRDRSDELASIVMSELGVSNRREATNTLHGAAQRIVRWG